MEERRRTLWSDLEDMERAYKMGIYTIPKEEMLEKIHVERKRCIEIYERRSNIKF